MKTLLALLVLGIACVADAAPKRIKAFVALCDNKTQGIAPVGEKIGNGNDADANLYWGCSDGLGAYFRRSGRWKVVKSEKDPSPAVLRRVEFSHVGGELTLIAEAYRGSEIKQCVLDFERAVSSGDFHLVAFIGHNGLMDFALPDPAPAAGNRTDAIVLCCLSEKYFKPRLEAMNSRPVLMTRQLMYPGSFLLHAAIETWRKGGSLQDIRMAAAKAYAKNQKISVKAAEGVFSRL